MTGAISLEPVTYFVVDVPAALIASAPLFAGAVALVAGLATWPTPTDEWFRMFHGNTLMDWIVYETYHNGLFPIVLAILLFGLSFTMGLRPMTAVILSTAVVFMLEYRYRKWVRDIYGTT